jgi:hypothetical protein
MKTAAKILFSIVFFTLLVSCSKKNHFGKWQDNDRPSQLELSADGKLQIADGSSVVLGKYAVTDDGKLKMQVEVNGLTSLKEFTMSVSEKDMTLTDEKGEISKFTRMELIK